MVEATKGPKIATEIISESQFSKKMNGAYPMDEEELIDFLNRCRLNNSKVMLCLKCSVVFDKEATKGLENYKHRTRKGGKWYADHKPNFSFNKSFIPFTNASSSTTDYYTKDGRSKTFVPITKVPMQKWVHSTQQVSKHGNGKVVKGTTSASSTNTPPESKRFAYNNNYKGKNPMIRTQWRKYQRYKKAVVAVFADVDSIELAKMTIKDKVNSVFHPCNICHFRFSPL